MGARRARVRSTHPVRVQDPRQRLHPVDDPRPGSRVRPVRVDGPHGHPGEVPCDDSRLLGSAAEAEDAVQDAYLRFAAAADDDEPVRDVKAFLTTILTRLGENITRIEEADEVKTHYLHVLDLIR